MRKLFEKKNEFVCIPFYPDNNQILVKLTLEFLKKKKISMSSVNVNYIVNLCNGDREILFNELEKIAINLNFKQVYVHSQSEALQFYKKAGYVKTGGEFVECRKPHQKMIKTF